jgi:hypothetical protein
MSSESPCPTDRTGELTWASVRNPLENRASVGKDRPVVVVEREGGHYRTVGLTTRTQYRDGGARVAIPNPRRVGLSGPGFLWGNKLTNVSSMDLGDHIGWADPELAEAVIELAGLDGEAAERLREAARRHHPDEGSPAA